MRIISLSGSRRRISSETFPAATELPNTTIIFITLESDSLLQFKGLNPVTHKHDNRDRPHTAGNRRDKRRSPFCRFKLHVADDSITDPIDADVNDDRALLDPVSLDKRGLAHGHDEDVRPSDVLGELARLAGRDMADSDRRVFCQQKHA